MCVLVKTWGVAPNGGPYAFEICWYPPAPKARSGFQAPARFGKKFSGDMLERECNLLACFTCLFGILKAVDGGTWSSGTEGKPLYKVITASDSGTYLFSGWHGIQALRHWRGSDSSFITWCLPSCKWATWKGQMLHATLVGCHGSDSNIDCK